MRPAQREPLRRLDGMVRWSAGMLLTTTRCSRMLGDGAAVALIRKRSPKSKPSSDASLGGSIFEETVPCQFIRLFPQVKW